MIYRIIAIAGIVAALSVGWYTTHLRLDKSNTERDSALASLVISGNLIAAERRNIANANRRATQYQTDRNTSNAELEKLRSCVADLSCGVRINTVYKSVPGAAHAPTGTPGTDAGHCRISEQDYIDLRNKIALTSDRYKALQRELVARSAPDYCQVKTP